MAVRQRSRAAEETAKATVNAATAGAVLLCGRSSRVGLRAIRAQESGRLVDPDEETAADEAEQESQGTSGPQVFGTHVEPASQCQCRQQQLQSNRRGEHWRFGLGRPGQRR